VAGLEAYGMSLPGGVPMTSGVIAARHECEGKEPDPADRL